MLCVTLKALLSAPWVGFQCLALGGWEWNVCLKWILSQSKHCSCSSLSFPPVICLPNFLQTHSLSGGTLQQGPHANGYAAICSDPNWRSIISSWCQGHLCHLCKHTQGAPESADNCHIEAFAKIAGRVKSDTCHNVLLMNHKLGKVSERSKQYGQSFLWPSTDMKENTCGRTRCAPCQIQKWKLHRTSAGLRPALTAPPPVISGAIKIPLKKQNK